MSDERYLPEVVRHPSIARAAVSPSAIAVTAAGVAIGIFAAHSVVLAVILGVIGWTGRMAVAVMARAHRAKKAKPKPAQPDPWSVPEPWRQLLRQALAAQSRFDQAVADWPPGPMRDRLASLQPRVYDDVEQVGLAARRGAALSGWSPAGTTAAGRPSATQLSDQLRRIESERAAAGPTASARQDALARQEEAVAAQLRAVRSAEQAADLVHAQLQLIVARLDEAVTSILLLGAESAGTGGSDALATSLDSVMDEITALHQGLADALATSPGGMAGSPEGIGGTPGGLSGTVLPPPTQPPPSAPTP
jgi:hypothetical protein